MQLPHSVLNVLASLMLKLLPALSSLLQLVHKIKIMSSKRLKISMPVIAAPPARIFIISPLAYTLTFH